MRRLAVLAVLSCAAALPATPALAASTTTQRIPPGGSMRSSADAAPSPANPVIVTVTNRNQPQPPPPPGSQYSGPDGSSAVTIALKDRAATAPGGNPEGPSGYEYLGPNVNISSADPANYSVVFELEGSLVYPDFLQPVARQVLYHLLPAGETEPGGFNYMAQPFKTFEPFGDGDFRLTLDFGGLGSYDLIQPSFFALAGPQGDSLPESRKKGVGVYLKTDYKVAVAWKIKVSDFVRRKLKLKSATIGAKSFAKPGDGFRRIPLTTAARRALKGYSRVSVTGYAVAGPGPRGEVIKAKKTWTLKTPESELG